MPPRPRPRQRWLCSRKDKTRYADRKRKKQSENEKCHNNVLLGSLCNGTITPEKNEEVRNQSFEGNPKKDKDLSTGSRASSPSHTGKEPAGDIRVENDLLISPTTGAMRRRNSISNGDDAFEEEALVFSTPIKSIEHPHWQESPDAGTSTSCCIRNLSFPGDVEEVWSQEQLESPAPVSRTKGDFQESHPTLVDSRNKVFTVSSISFIDAPLPGIYLRPSTAKVQVHNASPPPSTSGCPFQTVEDLLKSELPTAWEVSTTGSKTAFLLRMKASADIESPIQRSALINRDGSVQLLDVHFKALRLDHQLWQDLPCRVGLSDLASVDEFLKYVLELVNVFRSYEVCMGVHEPRYAELAAKQPGLVFDANPFKESRYMETFRSDVCEMLVSLKIRMKKYCSRCCAIRELILRRCKNTDLGQSPHAKTNNNKLNSHQKKHKFSKLTSTVSKFKKMVDYHKEAAALIIKKHGVGVDDVTNDDMQIMLDRYYNKLQESNKAEHKLQRIFIEQQLKASSVKGPTGMRWHPVMIRLALQVYQISPAAYEALSGTGIVTLPSARTLFDYSHFASTEEGINYTAVEQIIEKVDELPEGHHNRYFILLTDEMTISQNLVYSRSSGELMGFVKLTDVEREVADLEWEMTKDMYKHLPEDHDWNTPEGIAYKQRLREEQKYGAPLPDISHKLLSFMAVGVSNGIKKIVASYGVGNNLNAFSISTRTWEVVSVLEGNQAHVLGLVCDGLSANRKFIKLHTPLTKLASGTVFDTANRFNPRAPFYFFSDASHLLKTLRNNFHNSEGGRSNKCLQKDGKFIRWRAIVDLYNLESKDEIRTCSKLNAQVVNLNSYSKQKVSYAARVFSRSVANALEEFFPEEKGTIEFIRQVNDFFDCLNGAALLHGIHKKNNLLEPYKHVDDTRLEKVKAFSDYLQDWKKNAVHKNACLSDETIEGVEMTVHSFIACTRFMLKKGAPFILARTYSQDPLEQHFSKQRAANGGNRNPNLAACLRTDNKTLNMDTLGYHRNTGNTKVVRDPDYAEKLSAPLLKRKKSDKTEQRVSLVRRKLI